MKSLLNIGNSVSLFFIFLLFFSMLIVFLFDRDESPTYVNPIDIPKIELNNFTAYQINNKSLITKFYAKNAKQFDKFEEFNDVVFERLNNNIIDKIITKSAIKKGNVIFFDNGVNDIRDNYNLYTSRGIYHIDKNILEGIGFFSIYGNFQDIKGDDIYYNANNGTLSAKNINAKLNIQKIDKKQK